MKLFLLQYFLQNIFLKLKMKFIKNIKLKLTKIFLITMNYTFFLKIKVM